MDAWPYLCIDASNSWIPDARILHSQNLFAIASIHHSLTQSHPRVSKQEYAESRKADELRVRKAVDITQWVPNSWG